jgi:hypothetical protein
MDSKSQTPAQTTTATPSVIDIELLALDLTSCDRCRGTLTNIEAAIETLRPVLEVMGAQVLVRKLVIESEEQAHRHRFVTSPTIRVNGRDIAFETLESQCEACSDLCGCEEPAGQSCCNPAEQETCCEPSHKAACCETSEPATCGCR